MLGIHFFAHELPIVDSKTGADLAPEDGWMDPSLLPCWCLEGDEMDFAIFEFVWREVREDWVALGLL
jgi:hypothetical protein